LVDTLRGATLVPNAAVQRGAPGTFVYVVKPDETVAAQPVTLGPADDKRVVITKGLEPGQLVVTDGADRLKDGAKVRVAQNAAAGAPQPGGAAEAPTPAAGAQSPVAGTQPPAAAQPGAPANPQQHPDGQRRRRNAE
jgi:multidrug efflux system membrane fusion protein